VTRSAALAALALISLEGAAHAGRSHFGWLYDTETVPERGVELEQWLTDQHRQGPSHTSETAVWWAPVIGVTDQVEFALPIEWEWTKSDVAAPRTFLARYGAELRWRLVTSDPVDAPAWVPYVRFAVKKPITETEAAEVDGDFVLSYTQCRWHAVANVGVYGDVHKGDDVWATRSGAGVSIEVTDELRLGGELYGEKSLAGGSSDDDWVTVGPNLSWTHGRFWLSASYGVGVYNIATAGAPRIKWAVAF
jgi:hypothetical protein